MKLLVALVGLSMVVMVVMVFQAVRQELDLRQTRARIAENSDWIKTKEESIVYLKKKVNDMKGALVSVNNKIQDLKKKKSEGEASAEQLRKSLETCNREKEADVKKKTDIGTSIDKLKKDHEAAKETAQKAIVQLKQDILDRDKALCAFADTTKEEARKLCGTIGAPK